MTFYAVKIEKFKPESAEIVFFQDSIVYKNRKNRYYEMILL